MALTEPAVTWQNLWLAPSLARDGGVLRQPAAPGAGTPTGLG